MNTRSAKGKRVKDIDELLAKGQDGDFCITVEKDIIWIQIPGAGIIYIPVKISEKIQSHWQWDGNEDAPTITPSIHVIGQWHGYMTNGELVSC